jgi:Tetratricopeptide repeat
MRRLETCVSCASLAIAGLLGYLCPSHANPRKDEPAVASVTLQVGQAGCKLFLDDAAVGETTAEGFLVMRGVEPGDHYIHMDCPEQKERAFFVSPTAGQNVEVTPEMAVAGNDAQELPPLEAAAAHLQLRQSVQQAVRRRARGEFDEAVRLLREATRLDPENSDLHRELGITFLLAKQWARARVEMLEAVRHDPQDADAHNGLGYAIEKLGDLDGAVKEYRVATHLEPDDASYREHYLEALAKIAARQEMAKQK